MKRKSLGRNVLVVLFVAACIVLAGTLAAHIPLTHWNSGSGNSQLPAESATRLKSLGLLSLSAKDVPVAALLLYGDSVIGEGYNTVRRDHNAAGHAEINAISDAMRRIGHAAFAKLNRDSLLLISTFEPCPMCAGAMLEYGIKRVQYLKPKPLFYLMREELRGINYRWRWRNIGPEALQDSLFFSHPEYRPNN